MKRSRQRFDHPWGQYVAVALALVAAAAGILGNLGRRPIDHPAGVLVADVPSQVAPVRGVAVEYNGYTLVPRAEFELDARVLATRRYRFDPGAALAPFDFALGWGPMSDSRVLDQLEIEQSSRFFTIYPQRDIPDMRDLLRHSANMHLIPADARVADLLQAVRVGHLVRLEGRLVDASRADGYRWRTSLSRNDTGAGACELVFVERVWIR